MYVGYDDDDSSNGTLVGLGDLNATHRCLMTRNGRTYIPNEPQRSGQRAGSPHARALHMLRVDTEEAEPSKESSKPLRRTA